MTRVTRYLTIACGVELLLLVGMGLLLWGRVARNRAANAAAAAKLEVLAARAHRLDSLLAASQTADSARRAEDDRHVASHQQSTVRLGGAVLALDSTAASLARRLTVARASGAVLILVDSILLDSLRASVGTLRVRTKELLASLDSTMAADSERHAHDLARIHELETDTLVGIPAFQRQRDDARGEAQRNLARAIAAERGWPGWRRTLTGMSCATAGVSLVIAAEKWDGTAAAVMAGTGAVCALSLALP